MNNKSLILGGNGFIGSAIARRLVADGEQVVIMDRSYPNIKNVGNILGDVEYIEKDFFNEKELIRGLDGVRNVFHCITSTYPGSANDSPIYDVETNVIGTIKLLESLKQVNGIKLFFTSSGGTVYGHLKETPVNELHTTDPICSYGICKLAIEKYLKMYNVLYGLNYCVFRISNPYGETQDPRAGCGVITIFLDKVHNDQTIEIWGDGNSIRDYIYIDDAVDAIVRAKNANLEHHIYNIGSGEGTSVNGLLEVMRDVVDKEIDIRRINKRSFDVEKNYLDISRISDELGWKPETSIREGIDKMWKYIQ